MIQSRTSLFKAYKNYDQLFDRFPSTIDLQGEAARWQITVMLLTPFELLFTSIAKLLVLFRMLDFSTATFKVASWWLLLAAAMPFARRRAVTIP